VAILSCFKRGEGEGDLKLNLMKLTKFMRNLIPKMWSVLTRPICGFQRGAGWWLDDRVNK